MTNIEYLTSYVNQFVETIKQAGVKHIVMCPGSRSTPLAYGFAKSEGFAFYRQTDERSAAYFALGIAKATKEPVVLLCTSGTAAANFFPAIVEAFYARVPLLVVTADRPHELREVGAPQAIDQIHLFGKHVKWSVDFPLPEDRAESLKFMERHIHRAVSTSKTLPMGPVHINVPFREPLLLNMEQALQVSEVQVSEIGKVVPSSGFIEWYVDTLMHEEKGLLIVGDSIHSTEGFWDFARTVKWPVLVDPLSNLRTLVPDDCKDLCIDQYDALLKNEAFKQIAIPNVVIRFGAQPVSKSLTLFLKACNPDVYLIADESPLFRDSIHVVTHHAQVEANSLWIPIGKKRTSSYLIIGRKRTILQRNIYKLYFKRRNGGALAEILFESTP